MTTCSSCNQQRHVIGYTSKQHLPVEVCGCDVARSWLLVDWAWRPNPPAARA